jgi:GT2 family glycosyltransferase
MEIHDADLMGPRIYDLSDRLLSADPYFDSELLPTTSGWLESDNGRFGGPSDVPWLPATMLLVRRHVLQSIGMFDPYLAGSLQDADFCLRARSRGFRCLYAGNVTVHIEAGDAAETPPDAKRRFQERWSRFPELLFPEQVIAL